MHKIIIDIGHSKFSQGASNKSHDLTEYEVMSNFAQLLKDRLKSSFEVIITNRLQYNTSKLSGATKAANHHYSKGCICLSLHANAYDGHVQGCEMLYYHNSTKGKKLAELLQFYINKKALKNNDRGIKPKTRKDRGGAFLEDTKMIAVILEPFFIDNDNDLENFLNNQDDVIEAIRTSLVTHYAINNHQ